MKILLYYMLFIINMISIFFCFFNLQSISNEIVFFPLLILIIFEIFMIVKKENIINLILSKKQIFMSFFLSLLFFTMLPITSCLDKLFYLKNLMFINIILKTIFVLSLFFSLFYIFSLLFIYDCKAINDSNHTRKIIMIIITIISLVFICSTSTGFYDIDFPQVWKEGEKTWDNWHTFSFSFLIYFCKVFFNNPFFVVIISFILYLNFCNYALKLLEQQCHNKNILILFLLINIFALVPFDQLRYINKDIIFSISFCSLILTIIDYLIMNTLTKKIVINMIIFSTITVLFRHGAMYLIIFIFLVLALFSILKRQYKRLMSFLLIWMIPICSYFIINYIGFNILHGYKYLPNFTYCVPIYQIGAFAHEGYYFTPDEKQYLEQYLPFDYIVNHFEKYSCDTLSRIEPIYVKKGTKFEYNNFIKMNYNLFTKHPIFYIRSLLDLTNILWKLEPDNYEYYVYFYKYNWEYDEKLKVSTIQQKETILNKIVDPIIDIGLKKFLFNLRGKGSFPLFIIILSIMMFINKKRYVFILPVIIILFWYGCLFLSLPTGIIRYCLPFINIYPVIFSLALSQNNPN